MPGTWNFSLVAGDTFEKTVTWDDANGNPVNLDGYAAEFTVFDDAGNVVLSANSVTDGGITFDGPGVISILMQTAGVEAGCYGYTLVMTAGVVITTLLKGSFDLE